jgi:hypothetical protein
VNLLQETQQAAAESPASFDSFLILYLYYTKSSYKSQVFSSVFVSFFEIIY